MSDLKGYCSIEQLIGENAYAPNVYFAVVGIPVDHLRRSVEWGSALGTPK